MQSSQKGFTPLQTASRMARSVTGFTLIEMLIVIAVIVALASIILPSFKGMQEEGDMVGAKGEVNTIKTALESFYMHNSYQYPSYLTQLLSAQPRIINEMPEDRFNRPNNYNYQTPTTGYYVVWSNGPDRTADLSYESLTGILPKSSIKDDIVATNYPMQ